MTRAMKVFVNSPAPPLIASWFDNMMKPVIDACRFSNDPPGVELRSGMLSAGQARIADEGQRVLLAGRATLWGRFGLSNTYLHEVAHVFCDRLPDRSVDAHGPVFCLVLSCLYRRASVVPHLAGLPSSVSFYDFADKPDSLSEVENWQAEVVRFVMAESRKLADGPSSAEALATAANEAWHSFVSKRIAFERATEQQFVKQQLLNKRLEKLRVRLRSAYNYRVGWAACAAVGWCFAIFNGAACQLK